MTCWRLALAFLLTLLLTPAHAEEALFYVDDATHARLEAEHQTQAQLINMLLEVTAWRAKHGTSDYPTLETLLAEQSVLPMPDDFNWGFPPTYELIVRVVAGQTCTFIAAPRDPASGWGTFAIMEDGRLRRSPEGALHTFDPETEIFEVDPSAWDVVPLTIPPPPSISSLELRAQRTLRALAASEAAYRDQAPDKSYGSWRELLEAQYILPKYTPETIVDGYTIQLARNGRDDQDTGARWFRVFAVPNAGLPLRAFAIDESQQLRTGPAPNPLTEIPAIPLETWEIVSPIEPTLEESE